jgi:hypothetical protein
LSHLSSTLHRTGRIPRPSENAMQQDTLFLDPAGLPGAGSTDEPGFELGWDHARHGLFPLLPPGLALDGSAVGQGWRAGKAVFGARTLPAGRTVRQWLELRTEAWRQGVGFETAQLTAQHLASLEVPRCPVLRLTLGGPAGAADSAPRFERLNPQAAYAAGNVVQMSRAAATARAGVDIAEAVRRARRSETAAEPVEGLDAGAWWRAAVLRSFTTPLPFADAARLPLAVLPPNRVRLLNSVQGLQALLTLQFCAPGWGERLRRIADMLPEHNLRPDFNLFVGALVPRVLQAQALQLDLRRTLEDAWTAERVMRRWQHFALSLGEAGCDALLAAVAGNPLPGRVTLWHEPAQAVEGWGLDAPAPHAPQAAAPAPRSARRRTDRTPRPRVRHATALPRPSAT